MLKRTLKHYTNPILNITSTLTDQAPVNVPAVKREYVDSLSHISLSKAHQVNSCPRIHWLNFITRHNGKHRSNDSSIDYSQVNALNKSYMSRLFNQSMFSAYVLATRSKCLKYILLSTDSNVSNVTTDSLLTGKLLQWSVRNKKAIALFNPVLSCDINSDNTKHLHTINEALILKVSPIEKTIYITIAKPWVVIDSSRRQYIEGYIHSLKALIRSYLLKLHSSKETQQLSTYHIEVKLQILHPYSHGPWYDAIPWPVFNKDRELHGEIIKHSNDIIAHVSKLNIKQLRKAFKSIPLNKNGENTYSNLQFIKELNANVSKLEQLTEEITGHCMNGNLKDLYIGSHCVTANQGSTCKYFTTSYCKPSLEANTVINIPRLKVSDKILLWKQGIKTTQQAYDKYKEIKTSGPANESDRILLKCSKVAQQYITSYDKSLYHLREFNRDKVFKYIEAYFKNKHLSLSSEFKNIINTTVDRVRNAPHNKDYITLTNPAYLMQTVDAFVYPVFVIDTETIYHECPSYNIKSLDHLPFQYHLDVFKSNILTEIPTRYSFLSMPTPSSISDPRIELAQQLYTAIASSLDIKNNGEKWGTFLAHNASFDKRVIKSLSRFLSSKTWIKFSKNHFTKFNPSNLHRINMLKDIDCLFDWYDTISILKNSGLISPKLYGSYSLKRVLPAVCNDNYTEGSLSTGLDASALYTLYHNYLIQLSHAQVPPHPANTPQLHQLLGINSECTLNFTVLKAHLLKYCAKDCHSIQLTLQTLYVHALIMHK